ncbi:glycosyltransferase family 2 protein [Rhodophyticola sp. SM2404]
MNIEIPLFSVVIPARNEAANIARLIGEIMTHCASLGAFEIIVVDDASQDGMASILEDICATTPSLRVLRHDRSGGQSAALHSGVRAARGAVICTLDGDGQNPPSEIPKLVSVFAQDSHGQLGLVAGQRLKRQDSVSKRLASKLANALRAGLLKDGTRDTGCGLKAFRRDAFLGLPFFCNMHRYLPALFLRDGWKIAHVDVAHAHRWGGRSHYTNFNRALEGVSDLIGVMWLVKRKKPCRVIKDSQHAPQEDQ